MKRIKTSVKGSNQIPKPRKIRSKKYQDNDKQDKQYTPSLKGVRKKKEKQYTPRAPKKPTVQDIRAKEYKKQIRRIKNFIKTKEKQGFYFDNFEVPQLPDYIKPKDIEKIKNIKPKKLYEDAIKLDFETGEVVPAQEFIKERNKERGKRASLTRKRKKQAQQEPPSEPYYPAFSERVISNYRAHISHFPQIAQPLLTSWLDRIIGEYGYDDTATMLEEGASNGHIVTYQIAYDRELLMDYMAEMLNFLPNAGVIFKEDLMDAFEYSEDWNDIE